MSFSGQIWPIAFEVSQKEASNLKVLISNTARPVIQEDNNGPVLNFPRPSREKDRVSYLGINFENSPQGFHRLWTLYKASLYHLSAHAAVSDFSIYGTWAQLKDANTAKFSATLVEDSASQAYLKKYWPHLLPNIAYGSALSIGLMKKVTHIANPATKAMAATLSQVTTGGLNGEVSRPLAQDAVEIASKLEHFEASLRNNLPLTAEGFTDKTQVASSQERRLGVADFIYWKLVQYGHTPECPSLPYTESYGPCSIFSPKLADFMSSAPLLPAVWRVLTDGSSQNSESPSPDEIDKDEITAIYDTWLESQEKTRRIMEIISQVASRTHFESVEFPQEDYSEFIRIREQVSSIIQRVRDELSKARTIFDDDAGKESGVIDLSTAVQAVAAQKQERDYFFREEPLVRNDAWAILVDSSKSLQSFMPEVRGIAVCLEEVAKTLIGNPRSWGLYSFNKRFQIVKDFQEPFSNTIRERLGGIISASPTYLPDAILMATGILKNVASDSSKAILLVSDFYSFGYEGITDELAQSIRETKKHNVDLIGLGVNCSSRPQKAFTNFTVVDHPYNMLKHFVQSYLSYASTKAYT
ncbi:MAG: vWA domain-containing protein [Candidatus Bathyarchaeia archaeon]